MAGRMKRKPLQGVRTVVRFNWHLHAAASGAIVLPALAGCFLTGMAAAACFVLSAAALGSLLLSLAATWLAYDAGGLYELSWLAPWVEKAASGANLHAGFDETTMLLQESFPGVRWHVFDFYDPRKHTEISIRRARKAHPPAPQTVGIDTDRIPLADGSLDVAVLLLAAHEIRNRDERAGFFRELRRTLAPGGRVIVTEHLRDAANILAYSPGAWHFHPRGEWLATFDAAGFRVAREFRNNPLITTFILEAHEDPD